MNEVWDVANNEVPAEASHPEQLRFLIRYVVLAPSGHNTQPWLFKVKDGIIELYADRRRALPVVDPNDRELVMSCGAALFNLRVALWHFGYEDLLEVFPSPDDEDLLAKMRMGARIKPTAENDLLFGNISARHTNRQAFEDRPVPDSLMEKLFIAAGAEGALRPSVAPPWFPADHGRQRHARAAAAGRRVTLGYPRAFSRVAFRKGQR